MMSPLAFNLGQRHSTSRTRILNCKSGTRLGRKILDQSRGPIIEVQLGHYLCMTLPGNKHSSM